MTTVTSALRPYAFAVCLAVASALLAVVVASVYDVPVRDPDGIAGPAYIRLPVIAIAFLVADVIPRALRRRDMTVLQVVRERWSPQRLGFVGVGMLSFYLSYVSYRNLKGALPLARPQINDEMLLRLDRAMAFGHDPAALLHDLLGTGFAAYFLSAVYLLYLAFVPLSLGAALVWGRSVRVGSWYVTALCLNWILGALSYYLLPSLGPVFVRPTAFDHLPETGVSLLQESLASTRYEVLFDATGAGALAGVAGFASLHVSVVFTAALIAHLVGLPRSVRASLWIFLALTAVATAYFGWHYLIDDVAGLVLGGLSVLIAERVTRSSGRAPDELRADTERQLEHAGR